MSESKHTPGPWEVRHRFGRLTTVTGRQRFPICDTGTAPLGEANHRREEANARLIAAAPELLEALSKLRSEVKALRPFEFEVRAEIGNTNWACLMQRLEEAEAAIAKATGEA